MSRNQLGTRGSIPMLPASRLQKQTSDETGAWSFFKNKRRDQQVPGGSFSVRKTSMFLLLHNPLESKLSEAQKRSADRTSRCQAERSEVESVDSWNPTLRCSVEGSTRTWFSGSSGMYITLMEPQTS